MDLQIINTGYFKLDGGAMFGVVPKSIWQRTNPPDENNLCSWAMRCLLIQQGDQVILIDNGIGQVIRSFVTNFSFFVLNSLPNMVKQIAFGFLKGYNKTRLKKQCNLFRTNFFCCL